MREISSTSCREIGRSVNSISGLIFTIPSRILAITRLLVSLPVITPVVPRSNRATQVDAEGRPSCRIILQDQSAERLGATKPATQTNKLSKLFALQVAHP